MYKPSDLEYIYCILRKLRCLRKSSTLNSDRVVDEQGEKEFSFLDVRVFPRTFLLKLLDNRLVSVDRLAKALVRNFFDALGAPNTLNNNNVSRANLNTITPPEADEFFHMSMFYLYDFFIDFNWHEPSLDKLTTADNKYIKSHLKQLRKFINFRATLSKTGQNHLKSMFKQTTSPAVTPEEPKSPQRVKSVKTPKPSLSQGKKVYSPSGKRRVRFATETVNKASELNRHNALERDLKETHVIVALDLLLFAINSFIQDLCNEMLQRFASPFTAYPQLFKSIYLAERKFSRRQLMEISAKMKASNDSHFRVLSLTTSIKITYVINYILGNICLQGGDKLNTLYMRPRVRDYIKQLEIDVERKLIGRIAHVSLQVILDLTVSEINLPPTELSSGGQKAAASTVTDNLQTIFGNLLNMDGAVKKGRKDDKKASKVSTLNTGGLLKSSSRILAQIDNLSELSRDIIRQAIERLSVEKTVTQARYFLELMHRGLEDCIPPLSRQILSQLVSAKKSAQKEIKEGPKDGRVKVVQLELITAKVRCLKFIQAMCSLDRCMKDEASRMDITIAAGDIEAKVMEFADKCSEQTGSRFR